MKKKLVKLLPKNQFARSVSILISGTVGAQLLTILASPILSRLYTPEDFGLLAVYTSLLGLFSVIASLRYELAIPLPEDDQTAANTVALSLLIVLAMASVSGLMVAFWSESIALTLDVPALAGYLWLLPVGVVLIGTYQVCHYWAIRTKEFGSIAKVTIRQSVSTVFLQLAGFKLGGIALLMGQVAGQGVGSVTLARSAFTRPEFRSINIDEMKAAAYRYRQFPLYSTWAGFLNTAGSQLPPLLFASLFGAASAGIYALANRVLAMPMSVVGRAVSNVLMSEAAERHRNHALLGLLETVHKKLILIILGPVVLLILFASDLFAVVFGRNWEASGDVATWLALWVFFSFTTSPLSTVYEILEKQKLAMWMQFQILVSRLLGVAIGAYLDDFMVAVAAFSVANTASYLIYLMVLFRIAGGNAIVALKNYLLPVLVMLFALSIKFGFVV